MVERKQGGGGEREREREREADPSLNAARLKPHSVEEEKRGQGIQREREGGEEDSNKAV